MESKRVFYSELAYALGLVLLSLGTALMERADLGMSMVVAPAYILHVALSRYWPAFSFGMAEYVFQAFLLVVLSVVLRRGRLSYLFSFVTAVIYGLALDFAMGAVALLPGSGLAWRLSFYIIGLLLCAAGVSLLFHTYIAPEAYELFVKELAARYARPVDRVKTAYDCFSCALGVALSFAFFGFGHFEGVKLGTVACALVNGWLIGRMNRALDAAFGFRDALPLRAFFER